MKPTAKKLQCDIFAFDPESERLFLTMMMFSFYKASVKSLKRVLGKLNSQRSTSASAPVEASSESAEVDHPVDNTMMPGTAVSRLSTDTQQVPVRATRAPSLEHHDPQPKTPIGVTTGTEDGPRVLQKIRKMLTYVLEIPMGGIFMDSVLADLGIDSVLAIELFTEMREYFNAIVS